MDEIFNIDLLKKFEYKLIWNFSEICNFNCCYCYNPSKNKYSKAITELYDIDSITKSFNNTNKNWLILISGGEPFLVPDFLPLISKLSNKHTIQITTNLCSDYVYQFHNYILPEKVMAISASLHCYEREKTDRGFMEFIKKYFFLKEKGFPILVNYISYPPFFNRMKNDIDYLKNSGITQISVLTYRGIFEGKIYPGSYTNEQIDLINQYAIDKSEIDIATSKTNFSGFPCEAGHKFFSMNAQGDVFKCGTINKNLGNLFDGTFSPNIKSKICTSKECIDCYLGLVSVNRNVKRKRKYFSLFWL